MPKKASTPAASGGKPPTDVTTFLEQLAHPLKPEILALRAIILGADPRISESVKWNAPSFATSEHFATFHLRGKAGIQVVLHLGARPRPDAGARTAVQDPSRLLDWRGPDRAIVTFRDAADIDAKRDAFAAVIRQWVGFVAPSPSA